MNNTITKTVCVFVSMFSLVFLHSSGQQLHAQGFSISRGESLVTIEYDGKLVTRYHFQDADAKKPYFWPVIGPKGKSMTRAFPMETVA
jgi:hypothetical protein